MAAPPCPFQPGYPRGYSRSCVRAILEDRPLAAPTLRARRPRVRRHAARPQAVPDGPVAVLAHVHGDVERAVCTPVLGAVALDHDRGRAGAHADVVEAEPRAARLGSASTTSACAPARPRSWSRATAPRTGVHTARSTSPCTCARTATGPSGTACGRAA